MLNSSCLICILFTYLNELTCILLHDRNGRWKLFLLLFLAIGWTKFTCEIFCMNFSAQHFIYFNICVYNSNSPWWSIVYITYIYIIFFTMLIFLLHVRFYICNIIFRDYLLSGTTLFSSRDGVYVFPSESHHIKDLR